MIKAYLIMLRPTQWLKNLMLFFPPFLAGHIYIPGDGFSGLLLFCTFCLVSSAGYILNDLLDREHDYHHPTKKLRPISSGEVSITGAILISAIMFICGLLMAASISFSCFLMLAGYAVVSTSYSFGLKKIPIVDIFCVSAGFIIRLIAGGELFHISISPWLFLTVFLLAVFLGTGKRVSELMILGDMAVKHRASLAHYPPGFMDASMYMTGAAVLVTYSMYALNKQTLIYSVPLCLFGLLRYMLRIATGKSGDPTESLLKDPWLLFVGMVWVLMVCRSVYW